MLPKHIAILLAGFSLGAHNAASGAESEKKAEPAKATQPDIQFLEYLGTLEDDDENWTDVEAVPEPQNKAKAKIETAKPVERK